MPGISTPSAIHAIAIPNPHCRWPRYFVRNGRFAVLLGALFFVGRSAPGSFVTPCLRRIGACRPEAGEDRRGADAARMDRSPRGARLASRTREGRSREPPGTASPESLSPRCRRCSGRSETAPLAGLKRNPNRRARKRSTVECRRRSSAPTSLHCARCTSRATPVARHQAGEDSAGASAINDEHGAFRRAGLSARHRGASLRNHSMK
jgi:hypothetical protein